RRGRAAAPPLRRRLAPQLLPPQLLPAELLPPELLPPEPRRLAAELLPPELLAAVRRRVAAELLAAEQRFPPQLRAAVGDALHAERGPLRQPAVGTAEHQPAVRGRAPGVQHGTPLHPLPVVREPGAALDAVAAVLGRQPPHRFGAAQLPRLDLAGGPRDALHGLGLPRRPRHHGPLGRLPALHRSPDRPGVPA